VFLRDIALGTGFEGEFCREKRVEEDWAEAQEARCGMLEEGQVKNRETKARRAEEKRSTLRSEIAWIGCAGISRLIPDF